MLKNASMVYTENIPQQLKEVTAWICWREKERGGRFTKVPTSPLTMRDIDCNNPDNWMTFDEAIKASKNAGISGIGFVFSDQHDFVGVDIDHCISENGTLSEIGNEIIQALDSYTEVSPSGEGVHIICRCDIVLEKTKNSQLGLEMYTRNRFFTVTGDMWNQRGIQKRSEVLAKVYAKYLMQGEVRREVAREDDIRDKINRIVQRMQKGKNGDVLIDLFDGIWGTHYESQSEAELALLNALAFYTGKDENLMDAVYRESGMYREKWDEIHSADGRTYGQMTIDKAILDAPAMKQTVHYKLKTEPISSKETRSTLPPWYENIGRGNLTFKPGILAQHLKEKVTAISAGAGFYLYKHGVYVFTEDILIRKMIQEHLLDEHMKSGQVNDVYKLWENKIAIDADEFNGGDISHIINFKNGLFNIYTKELLPHSSAHLSSVQLNTEYHSEAECPEFIKFMNETLSAENVLLVQEVMGYLFIPVTKAQKSFLLLGPARTGKSTFLRIVDNIIGSSNISSIPLQDLGARFNPQYLYGKLINSFADLPSKPLDDLGIFKALTGEDRVHADVKGKSAFTFVNKSRMIFSANELPRNNADRSGAFYRRLIIIPFVNQVTEDGVDANLTDKLLKEKDGIVQWALEGLYRLMASGFRFTETASSNEMKEDYKIDSDSVVWFVRNYCELVPQCEILSTDLYGAYKNACLDNGLHPISHGRFVQRLSQNLGNQISKRNHPKTRRAIIGGITLLPSK